jgi:2-hydroxycyclohexanecarboxyl-CoA dehydrogenase
MRRFAGKVVVVTGAAQGVGRVLAEKVIAEGGTAVVADINGDGARATAKELGDRAIAVAVDVMSYESVAAMVSEAHRRCGRLDVLVNNAGWDRVGPFVESDPALWDRIVGINLYGVFNTVKATLPIMIEQGSGTIVNTASDAARVGASGEAVYSAAKAGVVGFSKAIAREVARHGIRVNCLCPGPIDTAMFNELPGVDDKHRAAVVRAIPLRRIAAPAEIANVVVFLASDEASFMTGQTVSVSGGLTMA